MVVSMKGIFHRQLLLAAGDTLCPLISTMEETAGCTTGGSVADTSVGELVPDGLLEQGERVAGDEEEGQMALSVMPL